MNQPEPDPNIGSGKRVLVADDQVHVVHAIRLMLKTAGYSVDTATSVAEAQAALDLKHYDLLLLDLNYTADTTSGREGLDLLPSIHRRHPTLPVVVMTAWGSVPSAVEAVRAGAVNYVEKPWDNRKLLTIVALHTGRSISNAEAGAQSETGTTASLLPDMMYRSAAMERILALAARIAPSDANVLITGESGTGKELLARWIHVNSPRRNEPFIAVNMGGLPEGVVESELFGHVRGAYTDAKSDRTGRFELANKGSLFLDEIANTPLSLQAKLLRVLQTGDVEKVGASTPSHVDIRVIAATNVNPRLEVVAGRFREDLLFRLNTIAIHLPPLRERLEDLELLATHFLLRHAGRYGRTFSGFSKPALTALRQYAWPGNVRELDHVVERSVLLADGTQVDVTDLIPDATDPQVALENGTLDDVERIMIRRALERAGGNVAQAAKALGVSRSALYRRMSNEPNK